MARNNGKLLSERAKRLEEVPGWSWDPYADTWNQNFATVQVFRNVHNRWPTFGSSGEEGILAAWVGKQRQKQKNDKLSSERVERLEGLPGWTWDPLSDTWNQRFATVQAFHNKHNRWPAFGSSGEEGVLAKWIDTQRTVRKNGKMLSDRVERLESITGWVWLSRC
jgi:hypothetical protein